jgi:hypothetical protein
VCRFRERFDSCKICDEPCDIASLDFHNWPYDHEEHEGQDDRKRASVNRRFKADCAIMIVLNGQKETAENRKLLEKVK